ncbi:MAG TPA: S41 family peptidase [Fimbriimonadaceae bacterium]|nr:S41 family peptidase [Fimbriimonadaceae bacterium]
MKALRFLAYVGLLVFLWCFGFFWRDLQQGQFPSVRALAMATGEKMGSRLSPEELFKQSFARISNNYYRPTKSLELKYAGMEGLMASLGDPHTMFLVPRVAENFALETRANFVGVGARLSPDPMGARIATVFDQGPADVAGLEKDDIITTVDGTNYVGKDVDELVKRIRGKEGTWVRLGVIKKGDDQVKTYSIKRARVFTPTVEGAYLEDSQIGYVSIQSFSEPTAEQFDRAIDKLSKNPLRGLVIDLRNNPGGLLETAVEMVSRFVEGKTVVTMKDRDGQKRTATSFVGFKRNWPYPIVVLIDEDSASAAEIFAGVLRDYRKATLVGMHSYGKASVQEVKELIDGASAKITVAKYFLPSAEDISRKVDADGQYVSGGLKPDVIAKIDETKPFDYASIGDPVKDPQLKKAIDVILGKA